jgi:surface polysaccharide O-acyltransferase-like enzyme
MERTSYYDNIKFLAIIMVCIYHFNGLNTDILTYKNLSTYINYLFQGSLSICVPLFFMVNGALLLNRPLKLNEHFKKTGTIFILVNVWSVILLLALAPICGDHYSFKQFLKAVWFLKLERNNHLWFLKTIISIYLLFPLLKLSYDQQGKKVFYYICFIFFFFSFANVSLTSIINIADYLFGFGYLKTDNFEFFPLINPFGHYFYSFFYFSLGGLLSVQIKDNRIKIRSGLLIAIFFCFIFMLFFYGVMMTHTLNKVYDTVWNGYDSIMALAMSTAAFILCSRISYSNDKALHVISLISRNTLGIYLLHVLFGRALIQFFKITYLSGNIFINIFFGFILTVLSLLAVLFIKKVPLLRRLLTA